VLKEERERKKETKGYTMVFGMMIKKEFAAYTHNNKIQFSFFLF